MVPLIERKEKSDLRASLLIVFALDLELAAQVCANGSRKI